jgi:hypothetical protein
MNFDVEKAGEEGIEIADGVGDRLIISLGFGEGHGLGEEVEGETAKVKL